MNSAENVCYLRPRKFPGGEVKLLRLEISPKLNALSECVGSIWVPAQPGEDLSPDKAAKVLKCSPWAGKVFLDAKQKKEFLRFPPEQFQSKYVSFLPAIKLLANATLRTSWFWQSGFIPARICSDASQKTLQENSQKTSEETSEETSQKTSSLVTFGNVQDIISTQSVVAEV